jgi:gas vesicle protein
MVGLEARRSVGEKVVTSLAIFGAGVLVGVGLGLMLAPRPGRELRSELRQRLMKGEGNGAADAKPVTASAPRPV